MNLAGIPLPALIVAYVFQEIGPTEETTAFFVLLALATAFDLVLNAAIVLPIGAILDGRTVRSSLGALVALLPTFGISMVLTLAIAEGYISNGLAALALLLVFVIAVIAYMSRLVTHSRAQAREYANLSWGILSSSFARSTSATTAPRATAPRSRASPATSPRSPSCPSATRSSRTPPACSTTSASSRCRTA